MNGGRRMPPVSQVEVSTVASGASTGGEMGALSRDDCVCTVCLEIFLEPVTLPCRHTFCKPCFLDTVDKVKMCCPLCRKRVSSWARKQSRDKTGLVDHELWTRVQAAFPAQCRRRLLGLEEEEDEEEVFLPMAKVSQPGEVRREYEDQISKLAEEKQALEDTERKASEEYIQRLLSKEEECLAQERRRHEERQLEDDERLAWLLSEKLNSSTISDLQKNTPAKNTPAKNKLKANTGDIEKFLCPIPPKHSTPDSSSSFMANGENILHPPFSPLPPMEPTDCPMPQLDYYARQTCRPQSDTTAASESPANHPALTSTKRKRSETNEEEAKRLCTRSTAAGGSEEMVLLHELTHQEHFSRQEQEDRKLALRLQKKLNTEERSKVTNRSKGSHNPYGFRVRQKRGSTSTVSSPPPE